MLKVLMVGPSRNVKGGMTTVVNNYFEYGLNKKVELKYIESCNDKSKIKKFIQEIKGIHEFKKNIEKYDIVHIHMASRRSTFRKIKYIKIAKKFNKKIVIHIHGGGFSKFYDEECNDKQKKFIKSNLNLAAKVIVLSEEWEKYFSKLFSKDKLEVLYNGVKIPEDYNKNLNNKNILFLGRINQQKGIYDLLNAISIIKNKHNDVCLYIGGSGEEEKIKLTIEKLNIKDNVKLLGWLDNEEKQKVLKKCAYFVLPSYFEGMPMSILEAMAYKCIVISTNVGSIPKVIQNDNNGMIVEPGYIDKITNVIEFCFENIELMKKMSSNARKTIEANYNIKKNIDKLLNIYMNI